METATMNKNKPEFDFENNRNCFDYHVIINDNLTLSGSMTPIGDEDYQETYTEMDETPFLRKDFETESRKLVKRFLRLTNKKSYETDEICYKTKIELFNYDVDDYVTYPFELQLTYCP